MMKLEYEMEIIIKIKMLITASSGHHLEDPEPHQPL